MSRWKNVELSCSFCGKGQREVRKLIAGPAVYICDRCISVVATALADAPSTTEALECSFCGKGRPEAKTLIGGLGDGAICEQCIDLCEDIIADEKARE